MCIYIYINANLDYFWEHIKYYAILYYLFESILRSKEYYYKNLRLQINEKFQQRCFKMSLLDWGIISNESSDFLVNFVERKMISIENLPTISTYNNEVYREKISYNIKNKFYLNFTIDKIDKDFNYKISIFITKKNKKKDMLSLIKQYLDLLNNLIKKTSS